MSKKVGLGARLVLGLVFVVFGLNGFFLFIPVPPMAEPAQRFIGAIIATHYLMPLVKVTEIVGGLLLLSGCHVPLALVLLGPVLVNILCFHLFLDFSGALPAIVFTALYAVIAYDHRERLRPILQR